MSTLDIVAKNHGYYEVRDPDGTLVSEHSQQHTAIAAALVRARELQQPVTVEQDLTLVVTPAQTTEPQPEPAPEPEPTPEPEPEPEPIPQPEPGEPIALDPQTYDGGYVPGWSIKHPDTGRWVFMPLMGANHSPETDNSVRVLDSETREWEFWQQDIAGQLTREEWFAGVKQTTPPSASGRNNLWGWYLPWEGNAGWLVIGAPGDSLAGNHGVYDIAKRAWTHLVSNDSRAKFLPSIRYASAAAKNIATRWNAADAVCSELRCFVRYGGSNNAATLFVARKQSDGGYLVSRYDDQPPGTRNSIQQQGMCRGPHLYIAGGKRTYNGEAVAEFWRADLSQSPPVWERLDDMPDAVGGGAILLHDTDHDKAILIRNDGSPTAYAYDFAADAWEDVTEALSLPSPHRAAGAYVPGYGVMLRGGHFMGGAWQTSKRVYLCDLDGHASEPPTEEPEPEPEPTPAPAPQPSDDFKVTKLPPAPQGQGPRGNMKHLSFEPGPDGRVYVFGGDWTADPGASYRRELFSVHVGKWDWRLESGYCPPSAEDVWPRGSCQAGLVHMGDGEFLISGGNWMNNNESYCGHKPKSAYVVQRHADGSYSIPQQENPDGGYQGGAYGQTKYGVWDVEKQRFLAIKGHSTIVQFKDGVWSRPPGEPSGSYLWSAQGSQNVIGRRWYMTDEKDDGLYAYDLATDVLERVADLPWPARKDGQGYEKIATAWWPAVSRLALMRIYDPETFTLYDPPTNTFKVLGLPSECIGNHLVHDPDGGGLVVFGRNDAAWGDADYFTRPHWLVEV